MTIGKKGLVIRYVLLKTIANSCGENVGIHPGTYMFNIQNISCGNNVSIHPMCYIDCAGGVEIGDNVSIAHGVSIMSSSHQFFSKDINIKDQSIICRPTIIKDNVWIGAKAFIHSGVLLNERCIIGASSVVTKDVKSNTIVAGVPAIKIKDF